MKKLLILFGFILFFVFRVKASYVIPDEAIRIRVIPNSNSEYDQSIKEKVKELLEYKMYNLLKDTKGVNKARDLIKNNLGNIKEELNNLLIKENYIEKFSIDYGNNYFPKKEYKGVKYNSGYYESLVITLGKGKGDNWWCVLFPPICLIEAEENKDVEYKFFVEDLFKKFS